MSPDRRRARVPGLRREIFPVTEWTPTGDPREVVGECFRRETVEPVDEWDEPELPDEPPPGYAEP